MTGRHRLANGSKGVTVRRHRLVELIDAGTETAHMIILDALSGPSRRGALHRRVRRGRGSAQSHGATAAPLRVVRHSHPAEVEMIGWHRTQGGSPKWHWGSLVAGGVHTSCGRTLAPPVMRLTQQPPEDLVCEGCRAAIANPAARRWYVHPGLEPATTHWGAVVGARVYAACGVSFTTGWVPGVVALPGEPPDPAQVCPHCATARDAAPDRVEDSPG